jgi:hypothetical protein
MPDMRTLLAILFLLTMSVIQVKAEATVKKYKAEIAANGAESNWKLYILGLGEGFKWANAMLEVHTEAPLFCPPSKLVLGMENYVDILDRKIKDRATKSTQAELDDMPLGLLLLQGIREAFPCK